MSTSRHDDDPNLLSIMNDIVEEAEKSLHELSKAFPKSNWQTKRTKMSEKLLIDRREKDEDVARNVKRVCEELDIEWEEKQLSVGDYVYKNAAIEYKSIDDAVGSSTGQSPRIIRQANDMAEKFDRAFIFIVGKMDELDSFYGDMGYEQMYGQIKKAMPDILASMNIPVQWVHTKNQFADIGIRTLVRAGDADGDQPKRLLVSPGTHTDDRISMLQGLQGFGASDSKKLMDKFGSIENICEARFDELKDIDGIGTTKAKRVYNTIRTEWNGEAGFDAKHGNFDIWEFMDISGVGDHILLDILKNTNELEDNPTEYVKNMNDISDSKRQKILDAIEQ